MRSTAPFQDALSRYHRMRGERTRWILGTDHAGIATRPGGEAAAMRGDDARGVGREAFVERVGSGASSTARRSSASSSAGRLLRLRGERFTLDALRARGASSLRRPLRQDLIYRDNYLVNWDPGSLGISTSRSRSARSPTRCTRSTTREGRRSARHRGHGAARDHPRRHRDRRASRRRAYTRLDGVTRSCRRGPRLRIIADPYVKPEFGTGALKITPGTIPTTSRSAGRTGSRRSPSSARTAG
jgi:valyl-tRNA synthetase